MGMFDHIRCDHPLPDGFDGGLTYQTKDTDEQYLSHYLIAADGTLWLDGKQVDHHGRIEFYTSNISGTNGKGGYVTDDGLPAWSRNYIALFDHGKLLKIEGGLEPEMWPDMKLMTQEEFWEKP